MKRFFIVLTAAVLLLNVGCSFKVKNKTFSIAIENVRTVTFQKKCETETGEAAFVEKNVDQQKDIKAICEKVRNLPLKRADSSVPQPIDSVDYVIIIKSEIDQHLILNPEKAFYDQVAYEYVNDKTFQEFAALYESLNYEEKEATADLY